MKLAANAAKEKILAEERQAAEREARDAAQQHQLQLFLMQQQMQLQLQQLQQRTAASNGAGADNEDAQEEEDDDDSSSDDEPLAAVAQYRHHAMHGTWVAKVKEVAQQAVDADRPRFQCVICLGQERRIVCVPCGHDIGASCFLRGLTVGSTITSRRCPVCRANIETVVQPVDAVDVDASPRPGDSGSASA